MVIVLDQYTPTEEFVKILSKSFNKQLELKHELSQKLKQRKVASSYLGLKNIMVFSFINGVIKNKRRIDLLQINLFYKRYDAF